MSKKNWTPDDKERFREMCLAGASSKELAEAFGCSLFAAQHKRSAWGLTIAKCKAMKAEQDAAGAHEETVTISAQAFFALAHELSENAETMEKLQTDNLELKTQLLNQSQLVAQLQDDLEKCQAFAVNLADELFHQAEYMECNALYRLFHRYKPMIELVDKTSTYEYKEAENAGND